MARPQPEKVEEELKTKIFREWKGVNTRSARNTLPEDAWYDLLNLQPIGPGNVHTINNLSAALKDFGADIVYWSQYANIAGVDYQIQCTTTGKVIAYNIGTQATTTIGTGFSPTSTRMTQWKNTQLLVIDTTGYYNWPGTGTLTLITGTGVPTAGTDIAVFAGRVWILQGRLITFSGVDDYTNASFLVANGAGVLNLTDSVIRNTVIRMIAFNGYLYLIAATAINVISDVYVPTGAVPPTPTFTNLNIQAIIGSDQPASVFSFNRALIFANKYGAWAISGVTAEKISRDIDGTWQYLDFAQPMSGAMCVSNNILTAGVLIKELASPTDGSLARTVIAMYNDNQWWFANYGLLTLVAGTVVNNQPAMYGFIGNVMYQLFADATTSPASSARTALWPMEDPLADKQIIRAGFEAIITNFVGTFKMSVDGVNNQSTAVTNTQIGNVQWVNNGLLTVLWTNNSNAVVTWFNGSYYLFNSTSPGVYSKYVGATVSSTGSSYQLGSVSMDYKLRARWQ